MAINFPSSPNTNDTHTVNGRTWVWDGAAWKLSGTINNGISLEVSDTAPATPIEGDMWYDSSTGSTFTYYDSVWVELGNTASVVSFIADSDGDTRVHVEESADEDTIRFDTAGTERLTITSAGHVLPSADVTYDLGSSSYRFRDLYLSGSSIDLGGVTISSDGTSLSMPPISSVSGDFTVDTSTLHVDSANNRVGIGTTSPEGSLHIEKDLGTAANDTDILQRFKSDVGGGNDSFLTISNIRESSGGSTWESAHHRIQHRVDSTDMAYIDFNPESAGRGLALGTDNAERVTIDSSGNVGIGTTSPQAPLSFANGVGNKIDLFHNTTGSGDRYGFEIQSSEFRIHSGAGGNGSGGITFGKKTTSTFTENVRITNDGNVGIGTASPNEKLHVNGKIEINGDTLALKGTGNYPNCINFNHPTTGFWHQSGPRLLEGNRMAWYWNNGSGYTETASLTTDGTLSAVSVGKTDTNRYTYITAWPNDGNWVAVNGGNGYLLLDGNYSDSSIYLRSYNTGGTVYLGAGHSNTLAVGYGSSTFSGNLHVGSSTVYNGELNVKRGSGTNSYLTGNGNFAASIYHATNSGTSHGLFVANQWQNDTSRLLVMGNIDAAGNGFYQKWYATGMGRSYNYYGTWGTISDETLKTEIVDANCQLQDILDLRFVNYKFIADVEQHGEDAPRLFGLLAQEVEQVSPGLVNDSGDDIKTINTSVLSMKAVKAMQEMHAIIETQQTTIDALTARMEALEAN